MISRFYDIFLLTKVSSQQKSSLGGKCRPLLACATLYAHALNLLHIARLIYICHVLRKLGIMHVRKVSSQISLHAVRTG